MTLARLALNIFFLAWALAALAGLALVIGV